MKNAAPAIMVDIAAAVLVMLIIPALICLCYEDKILSDYALRLTADFTDDICERGYLGTDSYSAFINGLNSTGNIYEISFSDRHKVYEPIYADGVFTGEIEEYECEYYDGEIFGDLERNGRFDMEYGDIFTVEARRVSRAPLKRLAGILFGRESADILRMTGKIVGKEGT